MHEKPRIAYLVSRYPALTHTFVLREIVALRARGFDVDVIAIHGADRRSEEMTPAERAEKERTFLVLPFGFHFVRAHVMTALRRPLAYLAGLRLALTLRPGHRSLRTRLFHAIYFMEAVVVGHEAVKRGHYHIHTHFSSTVGLIATRIFPLDLSISIHGSDEFRDPEGFRMREKVAASLFIRTISQYARKQITLNSDQQDWNKIRVCPLGVDTDALCSRPAPDAAEAMRLIFVGRLVPVKALHILIEACAQLVAQGCKLKLRLVGDGSCRAALEQLTTSLDMQRNVVFEGAKNTDEVSAFYKQSDIFVMCSLAEGVPVVLMEAMAMEIPCVATSVGGIPELIEDRVEGLLAPSSDPAALARAIGELIGDPDLRRRVGRAGREKVLREYDLKTNTERLAVIFQEELQARAGSPSLVQTALPG
ncbi:MAG: glycosyltransferase family 4 protein [Acidobacteriota bacterium]